MFWTQLLHRTGIRLPNLFNEVGSEPKDYNRLIGGNILYKKRSLRRLFNSAVRCDLIGTEAIHEMFDASGPGHRELKEIRN